MNSDQTGPGEKTASKPHRQPSERTSGEQLSVAPQPVVGVIMGSRSDWETMSHACRMLEQFGIPHEQSVVSAHRTPRRMFDYAQSARGRGLKVIIAGAGGAAHLPGMVASETILPVIGVPIQSRALQGLDSLLSIVQMPGGVPVATMAIGVAGAKNAAVLAARMLAMSDPAIADRVASFAEGLRDEVLASADLTWEPTS